MEDLRTLYESGRSIPEISQSTGICLSTVRYRLLYQGVTLRTRAAGVRLAAPKIGATLRGRPRSAPHSAAHREAISRSKKEAADYAAAGVSVSSQGYIRITRGPHKDKSLHIMIVEQLMGRELRADECVHHVDGNKQNNDPRNLRLMNVKDHAQLHALDNNTKRTRDTNGRYR